MPKSELLRGATLLTFCTALLSRVLVAIQAELRTRRIAGFANIVSSHHQECNPLNQLAGQVWCSV